MNGFVTFLAGAAAFAAAIVLYRPADASPPQAASTAVERGRYIVEGLAGCGDCHTPRDGRGGLRPDRRLMGAAIGFAPLHPIPAWADRAPALAGLPAGYAEGQLASFLQTGRKPNGAFARPPMPAFRMNAADAQAVAAYVKSLGPRLPDRVRGALVDEGGRS